jgi:uncharacterized protein YciI
VKQYEAKGSLLLGGAFNPPTEGATIIFRATRSDVEEFAKNDPYVTSGLVAEWTIKEWTVLAGLDYKGPRPTL